MMGILQLLDQIQFQMISTRMMVMNRLFDHELTMKASLSLLRKQRISVDCPSDGGDE